MLELGIIVGGTFTLCLFALTLLSLTAPEGWEDADGFHFGRPEDPPLRRWRDGEAGSLHDREDAR